MSEPQNHLTVVECSNLSAITAELDVFVLAMGFEDRAFEILKEAKFRDDAMCICIRYVNSVAGNDLVRQKYMNVLQEKFSRSNVVEVPLEEGKVEKFAEDLKVALSEVNIERQQFGIDVSGMTSYAICLALKSVREVRPFRKLSVFYTSAKEYEPDKGDYELLKQKLGSEIDYLPKSMALEMSDNLVVDAFSGHRSGDGKACLALFAGYEVHRSSGTIDATNPSLLLLMYGDPGDGTLSWRLDLSKRLHAKFEKNRRCATEVVSTLQLQQSLDVLEQYYNFLIDDHDLIIAPVCSKMHSVAAYLFWEKYGEIQLTFPLPIGYNPEHRPRGVGSTYSVELYASRTLLS
jgi:hypothetical protein